jgi:hypothetical protein
MSLRWAGNDDSQSGTPWLKIAKHNMVVRATAISLEAPFSKIAKQTWSPEQQRFPLKHLFQKSQNKHGRQSNSDFL